MATVAAHHLIWTIYGYWLPNDPRGSMSREIRADLLKELGEIHYGRKRVQPAGWEVGEFQRAAQPLLKHELLPFSDAEIEAVGEAFAETICERQYTCYACAVMPDHVHLVIRKHRDDAEEMIEALQEASARAVRGRGTRFGENHPVWGGPGWKVFLFTRGDIERTNCYVARNPEKARRSVQAWPFVAPYDGWLPAQVTFKRPAPKGEKGSANPHAAKKLGRGAERGDGGAGAR